MDPAPGDATQLQVSFEFFPPRTQAAEELLWASIKRLEPLAPRFVSVTYGAGGSTREHTHRTVHRILVETGLVPAAHLTCVGASRDEVDAIAEDYWQAGVRHIVALRGDPPSGEASYVPHPDGYAYAADLVAGLLRLHAFTLSVAAYPTGHPESPSLAADIDNLKRKVDAGATHAITQFFFDNSEFLRFRDRLAAAGVSIPVTPGIMPIGSFSQIARFAEKARINVPDRLREAFSGLNDDPATHQLVALWFAAEQVRDLVREGVSDFHFYTLNRADLTYALCHILGLRAAEPAPA